MNVTLEDILQRIESADDFEINEIMSAIRRRFAAIFPDWEVIYLSWPRNDPDQRSAALKLLSDYFSA